MQVTCVKGVLFYVLINPNKIRADRVFFSNPWLKGCDTSIWLQSYNTAEDPISDRSPHWLSEAAAS